MAEQKWEYEQVIDQTIHPDKVRWAVFQGIDAPIAILDDENFARLIAAAPDLLDACEDVLLELDILLALAKRSPKTTRQRVVIDKVTNTIAQVNAAIAKAKKGA